MEDIRLADLSNSDENKLLNDDRYKSAYLRTRLNKRYLSKNGVTDIKWGRYRTLDPLKDDNDDLFFTGFPRESKSKEEQYLNMFGKSLAGFNSTENVKNSVSSHREALNRYNGSPDSKIKPTDATFLSTSQLSDFIKTNGGDQSRIRPTLPTKDIRKGLL